MNSRLRSNLARPIPRSRFFSRRCALAGTSILRSIHNFQTELESKPDSRIPDLANELRAAYDKQTPRNRSNLTDATVRYIGLVAEAIRRTHGFRLHQVQIQAIIAGVSGAIVEMQTGEGKTVVTGAIAAVKSLAAHHIHVGTTNAYLASRDLNSLSPAFELLNISHGQLPEGHKSSASRRAYQKRIVYGPGYQFGFDYLKDQVHLRTHLPSRLGMQTFHQIRGYDVNRQLLQPRLHQVAIIDEADSVMIDEAMTPLVISLPASEIEDPIPYEIANKIANRFSQDDYKIERATKKITLTESVIKQAHEKIASHRKLRLGRPWKKYLSNAVRAQQLLKRNVDYVVVDERVQIVDQNTGRIFEDRSWQDGLHQAIEAKEGLPIQSGRESSAQITRQRYLQMYDELAGLTGTAQSVASEFAQVYRCSVVEIPTHQKCIRQRLTPQFFADQDAKLAAIASEVVRRHHAGQPILVGTKTIQESIAVQESLAARGLKPTLLNGVQDDAEADIVARAGIAGEITIATNMAGRGTDIQPDERALSAGGLHVIGVSPNASRRIDRQLAGRAARQGQPGSAQFFVAATDSLFDDYDPAIGKQIRKRATKNGRSVDFSKELFRLQDRIESLQQKNRQEMLRRDYWMDSVRATIEPE